MKKKMSPKKFGGIFIPLCSILLVLSLDSLCTKITKDQHKNNRFPKNETKALFQILKRPNCFKI